MKKALLIAFIAFLWAIPEVRGQTVPVTTLTAAGTTCVNGSTTAGSFLMRIVNQNDGAASFTINANAGGNTLSFYASGDGGKTYATLSVTPSNSTTTVTTTASTAAGSVWQANVAGYTNVCIVMTTKASGNSVVNIYPSTASARSGGGGGSSGITNIATTEPIEGGPITATGTLSCRAATGSVSGCLSAADFTTFNNKGSGTLTGALTATRIPNASGATALQDSPDLTWDGGTGLGTLHSIASGTALSPAFDAQGGGGFACYGYTGATASTGFKTCDSGSLWILRNAASNLLLLDETSGNITMLPNATLLTQGTINSILYQTGANCSSSASPAVCGGASAGSVVIAAGATTVVVNTAVVTANSQIFVFPDESLGTKLGVTCNSTLATAAAGLAITARVAATSFTITTLATVAVNPVCLSYHIVN